MYRPISFLKIFNLKLKTNIALPLPFSGSHLIFKTYYSCFSQVIPLLFSDIKQCPKLRSDNMQVHNVVLFFPSTPPNFLKLGYFFFYVSPVIFRNSKPETVRKTPNFIFLQLCTDLDIFVPLWYFFC